MNKTDVDYKYSLNVLKKINSLEKDGDRLSNSFMFDGYNLWQTYRMQMFQEIKVFSGNKALNPAPKKSLIVFIKDLILGAFLLLITLLGYLFSLIAAQRVLVYAVDRVNSAWHSDFRLEPLYAFLSKKEISYIEIFHTVPERESIIRFLKRKRFALYLECIDWLMDLGATLKILPNEDTSFVDSLDFSSFNDDEKEFVKSLVKKYVIKTKRSKIRIRFLTLLFKYSGLKVLFAIDDTRSYYEIIAAAKRAGLKTYAIQHGHFTKYHVGWIKEEGLQGNTITPDYLFVWSDYWKNELLRLGSILQQDRIIVGGTKQAVSFDEKPRVNEKKETTILIPYETVCPQTEVAEYIHAFLSCDDVRVVFKLRPDIDGKKQLSEYGLDTLQHEKFSAVTSAKDIEDEVDIVAGTYSTFLYDMIAKTKRVAILKSSTDYGEGLLTNNLADELNKEDDLCTQVSDLQNRPQEEILERKKKLYGTSPLLLEDTLEEYAKKEELL